MKTSKVHEGRSGPDQKPAESGHGTGSTASSAVPDDPPLPSAESPAPAVVPAAGCRFWLRRYGFIILLFFLAWACGSVLISRRHAQQPSFLLLEAHKTQTIRAKYPFTYKDLSQAQARKAEAAREQPAVFVLQEEKVREALSAFRQRLAALAEPAKLPPAEQPPAEQELRTILSNGTAAEALLKIVRETLSGGIRDEHLPALDCGRADCQCRARIISPDGVFERRYQTLLTLTGAQKVIEESFSRSIGHAALDLSLFWSDPAWQPTLSYQHQESRRLQEEAMAAVLVPVRQFSPGEVLVALSREEQDILQAYESANPHRDSPWWQDLDFGRENIIRILLLAFFVASFAFILCRVRISPANLRQRLAVSAIALMLHFFLVHCFVILYHRLGLPAENLINFLPLALIPALMANLLGGRTAICTAVVVAIAVPLQVEVGIFQYQFFYLSLFTSLVGVGFFQYAKDRRNFIVGGFALGLSITIASILFCLDTRMDWPEIQSILPSILVISYSNGLLMGILVMALLPVFEYCFGLVTLSTLLELNDTNHLLLRRLQQEAPGTYQHSLNVAAIAEAAALAIRANVPLTRVMALFHDIGKLDQPHYFAENFSGVENPHDSLSPLDSAKIICSHVAAGIALADKHHLRRSIRPAIEQHHGNSLITYFYHKAVQQAEAQGQSAPDEQEFRYQHPLPQQKEVVIVSLADACEAAVRSLVGRPADYQSLLRKAVSAVAPAIRKGTTDQNALLEVCVSAVQGETDTALTPDTILHKINAIIDDKWADKQFAQADITTSELETLKLSIQKTILEMHHFRPAYPGTATAGRRLP
ncbi:MAG: HDIG domain-containing protein [Oligosphaeraceae bacterium]|nr:HDIG domain-containing protein [Oligosphaeraceae bacterium]